MGSVHPVISVKNPIMFINVEKKTPKNYKELNKVTINLFMLDNLYSYACLSDYLLPSEEKPIILLSTIFKKFMMIMMMMMQLPVEQVSGEAF